jgi:hypothetical protein
LIENDKAIRKNHKILTVLRQKRPDNRSLQTLARDELDLGAAHKDEIKIDDQSQPVQLAYAYDLNF